jgi:hypothetical protein
LLQIALKFLRKKTGRNVRVDVMFADQLPVDRYSPSSFIQSFSLNNVAMRTKTETKTKRRKKNPSIKDLINNFFFGKKRKRKENLLSPHRRTKGTLYIFVQRTYGLKKNERITQDGTQNRLRGITSIFSVRETKE